jgi:hypothetical protein
MAMVQVVVVVVLLLLLLHLLLLLSMAMTRQTSMSIVPHCGTFQHALSLTSVLPTITDLLALFGIYFLNAI